jgi:hypothetical protein
MKKTLEPTGDMMIRFTEDELSELNIKQGDKFDFVPQADGSIKLDKYVDLELDMAEWPRELLEMLIKRSCEQDVSINEIIINLLEGYINNLDSDI